MKTNHLNLISTLLIMMIFLACSKDESQNQTNNENYPYEKYELVLTGDFVDEYSFDESLYVAVGGELDPIYETYLDVVPNQSNGTDMLITLYPPPGHPLENNFIGITIRSEDPQPWSLDKAYIPSHHSAIPYINEYAIVEYWDDDNSKSYVSRYIFQASETKVKLTREGDLLHGELMGCKLTTFNGQGQVTIQSLQFRLRPSDSDLID